MKTIIKKAETFRRSLKFTNIKTGGILDLTGCVAYSQMRKSPGGDLLDTATCSINTGTGVISVLWSADMTAAWPLGDCGFDVWIESDGEQKPIYTELCAVVKSWTDMTPPDPEPDPEEP